MRLHLGNLPLDVLEQICSCLDRSDLLRLSLVNRKCRSSSMPYVFRTVHLTFSSPGALQAGVQRLHRLLSTSSCLAQVHDIHILTDQLVPVPYSMDHVDCGDQPSDTWKYCRIDGQDLKNLIHEEEWQTLCALLKQLPALRSVFWCHGEQIPRSLLRYINECLPRCQLHLPNFRLRSIYTVRGHSSKIDAYDLELATSPCLSSVALMFDYTERGLTNFNSEAIKEMVAGAAPGLKVVSILHTTCPQLPGESGHPSGRRARWIPETICSTGAKLGTLHHLELDQGNAGGLKTWSTITDFSLLRTLKYYSFLAAADFRWLTDNVRFSSLQTLVVKPGRDDSEASTSDLADAIEVFIRSLPPLQSVKLVGVYTQRTVSVVLEHCGRTLRELYLGLPYKDSPTTINSLDSSIFANPHMLGEIRTYCPNLEVLALPMLRSQGDKHEVAIYRSFGQMPKLRKLYLSIYGSQPFLWAREWAEVQDFERFLETNDQDGMKDIHNALIDFAIDETLAKSICSTISTARAPYATPFESLEIRVRDLYHPLGPNCSMFDMIKMLRHMAQSWICTRSSRDDEPFNCIVMEPYRADRAALDRTQWHTQYSSRPKDADLRFGSAISTVWPGMSVNDWRKEWHSFPLAK